MQPHLVKGMEEVKKVHAEVKSKLHPRNKNNTRYNFDDLIKSCPELKPFVKPNKFNDLSVDFFNPKAVKALNKALLFHYYGLKSWNLPEESLCPPVPGRADYIHYIADLLAKIKNKQIPTGKEVKLLDIGTGASCIYPLIGNSDYKWSFIGSDTNEKSVESAKTIIEENKLSDSIEVSLQKDKTNYFKGILKHNEKIHATVCNPPFFATKKEAEREQLRKLSNLKQKRVTKVDLNFGGQHDELWCTGGEKKFIREMANESKQYRNNCMWFTTLVSRSEHLDNIYQALDAAKAKTIKTIPMGQGNKISRIVAWTFLSKKEQREF